MVALKALLRWMMALAGATIGCAFAVWLTLWISVRSSAAHVPQLRGQEPSSAVALVREAGLVARIQEGVFDETIAAGLVAVQKPPAGFQLKRGATVLLYPSLGVATQRVPNLIGLPESIAENELDEAGLVVGRRLLVEEQGNAVTIIAQSPEAHTLVGSGATVAVLVNRTPARRRYVMPDLVGIREQTAVRVLRALGFRLAALQQVTYQGLASGVVLRQDPVAGEPVLDASVVALWVSR